MTKVKQITKRFDYDNSSISEFFEPIIEVDAEIEYEDGGISIDITEKRFSVIIEGIEIDITKEVKYELGKRINFGKAARIHNDLICELEKLDLYNELAPVEEGDPLHED